MVIATTKRNSTLSFALMALSNPVSSALDCLHPRHPTKSGPHWGSKALVNCLWPTSNASWPSGRQGRQIGQPGYNRRANFTFYALSESTASESLIPFLFSLFALCQQNNDTEEAIGDNKVSRTLLSFGWMVIQYHCLFFHCSPHLLLWSRSADCWALSWFGNLPILVIPLYPKGFT